jgi:hypothetical protein
MRLHAFIALALLLVPQGAQALCRDEIKELQPRIERLKHSDPQRYQLAMRWWGKAVEEQAGSESQCDMYVTRTRKVLSQSAEQVAQCKGPDLDPAHCDAAGNPLPAFRPPAGLGLGGIGVAGGGGAPGPTPFTPPGSPDSKGPPSK